jgi:hypothetical protein
MSEYTTGEYMSGVHDTTSLYYMIHTFWRSFEPAYRPYMVSEESCNT